MTKGITLIELTFALAVLMVVLGVILAGTSRRNNYGDLYNAARIVQADMRYAQRRAVMEGRRFYVTFVLAENIYHIGTRNPIVHYHTNALPHGVTFVPHTTFPSGNRAGFTPRGTPTHAGTVTLQKGRYQRRITVIPNGGRVEIKPVDILGGN